ncbi:selenide water dikinase [Gonapodya prolifera JEL478]|uniref:Selenide water dikinase n=1 Tax=Gonapodya prolifera (strain JEL478) TaxID=1344416 RepID=A0A139B0S8_GONPJ|nr:selenide water dikinase [Gonapodya prolifera JEL478]|eukprot:KXS22305.1 selenide water dikinase [Gonapodya prolifera JEL478]
MDSSITDTKIKGVKLVQTTDFFYPNVDDPYWQGRISAANVLSDLYAMGVPDVDNVLMLLGICRDPRMLRSDRDAAARLMMEGFRDTCAQAGTCVKGGQTVMSPWFILGGVATTVQSSVAIIYPTASRPGDVLVLTKPLGTQVASNVHVWLKGREQKPERWDRVANIITEEEAVAAYETQILTMSRLNRTAAKLARKYGAHGCTDVTGFGLLGHAQNLASNQKRPVEFVIHTIPVIKKMADVNARVNYRLLEGKSAETSGGLLIALPRDRAHLLVDELQRLDGWPAWIVGDVQPTFDTTARTARIISDPTVVEVDYRSYDHWNEDGNAEVVGWEEGWERFADERDN